MSHKFINIVHRIFYSRSNGRWDIFLCQIKWDHYKRRIKYAREKIENLQNTNFRHAINIINHEDGMHFSSSRIAKVLSCILNIHITRTILHRILSISISTFIRTIKSSDVMTGCYNINQKYRSGRHPNNAGNTASC